MNIKEANTDGLSELRKEIDVLKNNVIAMG
jgi:uncharacterized membrane protein